MLGSKERPLGGILQLEIDSETTKQNQQYIAFEKRYTTIILRSGALGCGERAVSVVSGLRFLFQFVPT